MACYIALAMAPTVLILVAAAGLTFGARSAEGRLVSELRSFVGYAGTMAIQRMIGGARASRSVAATLLGLVTVFFAASAVVSELRDAMNTIWKVPEDSSSSTVRSIYNLVKDRILCFALVLASGLFLVASLIVNAWIFSAGRYLNAGAAPPRGLVQTTDWLVSFVVITVLFAFIFKVLPRVAVQWADVALAAVATSLLFTAGKVLLGVYLARRALAIHTEPRARSSLYWYGSIIRRRGFFWAPNSRAPMPAALAHCERPGNDDSASH